METSPLPSIWKIALYIPTVLLLVALLTVSRHLGSYVFLDVLVIFVLPGFIIFYAGNVVILKIMRLLNCNGATSSKIIAVSLLLFFVTWFTSTNITCTETDCLMTSGLPLTVYQIVDDRSPFVHEQFGKRFLFDTVISAHFMAIAKYKEYQSTKAQFDIAEYESPFRPYNLLFNFFFYLMLGYLIYKLTRKRFIQTISS